MVAVKGFAVKEIACKDAGEKDGKEEQGGVQAVGMAELDIDMVVKGQAAGGFYAHGLVHEVVDEKAEEPEGQTAVVQVIALVPGLCSRQNGWDHIAQHEAEEEGQGHAGTRQVCLSEDKVAALGVAEEKFTDKGGKGGSKHTDMEVALKIKPFVVQIDERSKEAGPHIEEIQAIEAVGHYQKVTGHGICMGFSF